MGQGAQVRQQGRCGLIGQLFGQEVAARQGRSAGAARTLCLPKLERLEQSLNDALGPPQHQRIAGDLLAGGARGAVVRQVDAGRGAVVLTRGVDRLGMAKAALVLAQRGWLDVAGASGAPAAQGPMQVEARIAANHAFWERRGLNQVEPVVIGAGEGHVGGVVHVQRGGDVEHAERAHARRMVQRQAMRHPPATVVTHQRKTLVPEVAHQRGHVLCHRTLAVVGVVGVAWRLG